MQGLSLGLIAHETGGSKASQSQTPAAFRVCEKLRPHLATLMGNTGIRTLLARSLALASAEVPWLRAVQVKVDGCLEMKDELQARVDPEQMAEGNVILVAQLLGLLVAFIGENLTLGLVREVWPKLPPKHLDLGKGDQK